ncbi:MAG: dimethylamine dehydrogenase, partial [Rhodospirillaceae bacterium]|nr:dimethylamine dehydrogenase [Rhodospirillaceae bacterium]
VGVVGAEEALAFGAGRIVVATGARWAGDGTSGLGPDPIPGVDAALPGFVTPEQVWAGKAVGRRVAILDGDGYFMAASLAQRFAAEGRTVSLVTPFDKVAPYTDYTLEGANLRRLLRELGVVAKPAHWVERAEGGSAADAGVTLHLYDVYRDGWQRTETPRPGALPRRAGTAVEPLPCDTVVLCTSRRSEDSLFRALRARRAEWAAAGLVGAWRAGDCLAPRYLADAVFDGHRMGREIDSPDPGRPRPFIRERPIWAAPASAEPRGAAT